MITHEPLDILIPSGSLSVPRSYSPAIGRWLFRMLVVAQALKLVAICVAGSGAAS
jgi:hypothetical protein